MLVLSLVRYPKGELRVGANGDEILVRYLGRDSQGRARIGLEAPRHITVDRIRLTAREKTTDEGE